MSPPTTFYIDANDIDRERPKDICRARDPNFLSALIDRVTGALPPAINAAFQFEDFDVHDDLVGKGQKATLRFKASRPAGQGPQMMFATGDFDPRTCALTNIKAGVGVSPYESPKKTRIRVP